MTTLLGAPARAIAYSSAPTARPQRPALRRALAASYIGSAVEFYDFFIYGTAAALVFPTVFFPSLGPTMAVVASLASFATAFIARPVGAVVFGHFGDRIGRKRTLMVTLLLMGFSTIAVGLLPGAATIGLAAPLLLIALRLLQGFAVGGEWAGAALLCAENAPRHLRGRAAMVMQLGIGSSVVLANLVFLLSHRVFSGRHDAFLAWGWRLPFLFSAVLIGVGIYVRLHLEETAEFAGAAAPHGPGLPLACLLRNQGRQLLVAAGAASGAVMLIYQASTFLAGYAETHLNFSKPEIFSINALGGVVMMVGIVASGILSDRFGRRRVASVGYGIAVPWSLVILPLSQTGDPVRYTIAVTVTSAIIGVVMSPLTSLIPSVFSVQHRYTGAALANNLGAIAGGAIPPVISPLLMAHGGAGVSALMMGFSLVSLISVRLLRDDDSASHAPQQ